MGQSNTLQELGDFPSVWNKNKPALQAHRARTLQIYSTSDKLNRGTEMRPVAACRWVNCFSLTRKKPHNTAEPIAKAASRCRAFRSGSWYDHFMSSTNLRSSQYCIIWVFCVKLLNFCILLLELYSELNLRFKCVTKRNIFARSLQRDKFFVEMLNCGFHQAFIWRNDFSFPVQSMYVSTQKQWRKQRNLCRNNWQYVWNQSK